MREKSRKTIALFVLGFTKCMIVSIVAHAADPDALWRIVHERCVPNQQLNNDPKPCIAVDLTGGEVSGHVILKDRQGATQFLLIPTAKISGIESPDILDVGAPNYFAAAWAARSEVEAAAHRALPREDIGLAINSVSARTQNQLHIHIDCLRPDVIAALRANGDAIHNDWSPLSVPLVGHTYFARQLSDRVFNTANPFQLLAEGVPGAAADMGHETLVVAGATFPDGQTGIFMLADHADLTRGDFAGGEELLDHTCKVADANQ